jgi:hypothetical protein
MLLETHLLQVRECLVFSLYSSNRFLQKNWIEARFVFWPDLEDRESFARNPLYFVFRLQLQELEIVLESQSILDQWDKLPILPDTFCPVAVTRQQEHNGLNSNRGA